MNIGSKKLFQNLSRSLTSESKNDAAVLPLVPGQKFEPSAIFMSARDLIERLCFERFTGVIYFQGEDARGDLLGVALVEGDRLIGALFSAGPTQWVGAAAWTLLCDLKTLPQCLTVEVAVPLLHAYSALLKQTASVGTSADARRLQEVVATFAANRATGALRVSVEAQTLIQFFHAGQSLGVYAVDSNGHLTKKSENFDDAPPLPRKAKLEVWTREEQNLFRSPCPFDAKHTHALACFLGKAFELGLNLMPQEMARTKWSECVAKEAGAHPWVSKLGSLDILELPPVRRLAAFETVLKNTRENPTEIVQDVSNVVDAFLAPVARSIGTDLFVRQSAKVFSSAESVLLRDLEVSSRWLQVHSDEADGVQTGRVLDAVAGARFSQAPRRVRTKVSTFDF